MNKKLTDSEIVKGLECCSSGEIEECKNCPYVEGYPYCDGPMERDVLDLTNRLQAEKDDLFYKLVGVMHSVDKWLDGDELKQDEVNRAATMREKTLKIVEDLQAENERLKLELADTKRDLRIVLDNSISVKLPHCVLCGNGAILTKSLEDYDKLIADISAEAYKTFVERLEKEIFIKQEDERKQMLKILKTYRGTKAYSDTEQATDNWLRGYGEAVQDILGVFDNLLKELVGDEP